MRAPCFLRATRVELTPEGAIDTSDGVLRIEETSIRFRSDAERTGDVRIAIPRIVAVETCTSERLGFSRASPGLAIRLLEHVLLFALDPDALIFAADASGSGPDASGSAPDASSLAEQAVTVVRRLMAAQFAHRDEVRVSLSRGGGFTGSRSQGQHAVLAVSDLSWGQDAGVRPIMVQVWSPRAGMAWKRKVLLSRDVHEHLRSGFDNLVEGGAAGGARDFFPREHEDRGLDAGAAIQELGTLLLYNTLTPHAIDEIEKLQPSFVTLVVDATAISRAALRSSMAAAAAMF